MNFAEHVDNVITVFNQRLYLLQHMKKQGLNSECLMAVFSSIVVSKIVENTVRIAGVGWIYKSR